MHEVPLNTITYRECYRCERRAGWIAVFANLALALFKAFVGILSGSKAILVDSIYSFKDFLTSLVVFIGVRVSGKPADDNHPYGHGKIEFVAIFLISVFIIIGTLFLLVHSVKDVWLAYQGNFSAPRFIAFWAALISVIANYKLSAYLHCVGIRLKSPALLANAQHNHSDAISSAMVAGAILGTRFGLHFLDPLVAVIETIDLIRLSAFMLNDALKGMMDSSVNQSIIDRIHHVAGLVPGVQKVPKVMARKVGQGLWVDIIVRVNQDLNYEEGHQIGLHVEHTLMGKVDGISGINISVEPNMVLPGDKRVVA